MHRSVMGAYLTFRYGKKNTFTSTRWQTFREKTVKCKKKQKKTLQDPSSLCRVDRLL
jgi:hypothetical protein